MSGGLGRDGGPPHPQDAPPSAPLRDALADESPRFRPTSPKSAGIPVSYREEIELDRDPAGMNGQPAPGAAPLEFSAVELAAIFPPPPPAVSARPSFPISLADEPDDAKELLTAEDAAPPTPDELRATLAALGEIRLLRMVDAVAAAAALHIGTSRTFLLTFAACTACTLAANAAVFSFGGGTFGTPQLAAGMTALAMVMAAGIVMHVFMLAATRGLPRREVLLARALSGLHRWGQAVLAGAPLLAHVDGDDACPCHTCCSRTVLAWSFWERTLRTVPLNGFNVLVLFASCWTPLVYYGSFFWASGAYVALGVLLFAAILVYNLSGIVMRFGSDSSAETDLETRIYLRASFRAIQDLLDRYRRRLLFATSDDPSGGVPEAGTTTSELYVRLHLGYRAKWERTGPRKVFAGPPTFMSLIISFFPVVQLVAIAVNLAAGGCITLWCILNIVVALYIIVVDTSDLPAINQQIDALSRTYTDAVFSIRGMLAEAARLPPDPRRAQAAAELEAHAGFLAAFGTAEGLRATFLGIPVTWGLAKTLAVTAVTLGVALWSVLRGAGVSFTVQSMCPS
ncbi:hypothetical protein DFJ74DRAFT_73904 [Hyaloraphidium curvatum]|nr:hypothetical protein DFJ74DRAFT_73904 [Hyaloraphidium curvatum]